MEHAEVHSYSRYLSLPNNSVLEPPLARSKKTGNDAETKEMKLAPLAQKDFLASISTLDLMNAGVVAMTSTFQSNTSLPAT